MTAPKLTPERIAEIRSYTTDNNRYRWWSEFGMGDALVFVEELLDGIEAIAAEADRLLDERDELMREVGEKRDRHVDQARAAEAKAEEQRLSSDAGWERVHKLEDELKPLRALADRYREALTAIAYDSIEPFTSIARRALAADTKETPK
jgi:cell division septum initiation protein DivIVA